jgi:hypothetical protein
MSRGPRHLVAAATLGIACFGIAAPSAAADAAAVTYKGAFEFEGLAANKTGKTCEGEGAFGQMKPGARVTISEQDAAGDFSELGIGKLAKGKNVKVSGEKVCRMKFRVKAPVAPAADSTIYLEIKGVAFDIRFPAADVADGDLGTWTCEYSDNSCASVVG